jgi:hypothetical protein
MAHGGKQQLQVPSEIVFEVYRPKEGGYAARAVGYSIFTEGDTRPQIAQNVRAAVLCYFAGKELSPTRIRLRFIYESPVEL